MASEEELLCRVAELEKKVERLEGRLAQDRRVFLQNPMPAIVYDPNSLIILDANDSALALYGHERSKLETMTVIDLFAPEALRQRLQVMAELR